MKNLNLVPLNGLRAVEAVGRLGSLKAAATELGVTIGAVSQQIQKVEQHLGNALFIRHPKGLIPNTLGELVLPHLASGMAELSVALAKAGGFHGSTLVVSVAPVFAAKWLVWRLKNFYDANPAIRIRVDATTTLVDPNASDVDVCIRVGNGPWPGLRASKLIDQRIFPVCSPAIAASLRQPEDMRAVPVIRDAGSLFDWNIWLTPFGLTSSDLLEGPIFSDASLCLDAAVAGQGIFMAWETLAHDALAAGQVAAPFEGRFATGAAYWFITRTQSFKTKETTAFERWLRDEMAMSFEMA
ncbi:MAG: LysR family transcriptional regulator [Hoeflea sp.]|uniref:LysR substrate-binding domain-containing protein n=1 Tax=Hoeflea sp. TaxID=1940281 RepID=UPI001E147816|nr:LysR substrate-binding domain-containing protein [Hoeflea sp.]MBU4527234.1 LysR family transcriptional regulator [Alphaproteobacteria bacterium]MBU4546983.1 LysR family transcriptional regulator [Alphaproteobacteria bacterium]MBU4551505.1 LysR family transcriptional regulator [Alphaproteobacteria bacterium]MBV1725510.1 LysR family transcriptional regulator [Hoeflea sp.]MBV1759558.1 LysR family transcriptional regulator [Hoeflea sp.]